MPKILKIREGRGIQKVGNQRKISQGGIFSHKMVCEWSSRTVSVSAQQHHLVCVCSRYSCITCKDLVRFASSTAHPPGAAYYILDRKKKIRHVSVIEEIKYFLQSIIFMCTHYGYVHASLHLQDCIRDIFTGQHVHLCRILLYSYNGS